jgi:hypothetical protein
MSHAPSRLLAPFPALGGTSRVAPLGTGAEPRGRELVALLAAGAGAGVLTAVADLDMGIPGNHILFAMFPIALGFALVPRRTAGTVMGAAGVTTLAGLGAAGVHLPGPGALAGLALAGPLLDLALRWSGGGWRLYAAFIAAGAGTNVLAFLVRGTTKYFGLGGMGGGRNFASWLPVAVWTYALAGILAGFLSAAAWFHFRSRE